MALSSNIGDIFGGIGQADSANDALERLRKMGIAPEYYSGDYEDPQYAGDLNPVMFDDPEEAKYQLTSEDPRVRGVEMDALQKLVDQASGAADIGRNAASAGALDEANQLANAREGAIRMDAERKGQGGAGMDMMMRAQSAQMGANRAKTGTLDALHNAALEKMAAEGAAIGTAGNIRGQDESAAARRDSVVNDFNRYNVGNRNAQRAANTQLKNDAAGRNLNARQGMNNAHSTTRNASIDRKDRLANSTKGYELDRFDRTNALTNQKSSGIANAVRGGIGAAEDVGNSVMAGMGGKWGGAATKAMPTGAASGTGAAGGAVQDPYDPEKDWLYA